MFRNIKIIDKLLAGFLAITVFLGFVFVYTSQKEKIAGEQLISEAHIAQESQKLARYAESALGLLQAYASTDNPHKLNEIKSDSMVATYNLVSSLNHLRETDSIDPYLLLTIEAQIQIASDAWQDFIYFHDLRITAENRLKEMKTSEQSGSAYSDESFLSLAQKVKEAEAAVEQLAMKEREYLIMIEDAKSKTSVIADGIIGTANSRFDQAQKEIYRVEKIKLLMLMVSVFIAFIYAFFFTRSFTRPIEELSEISRKISKGNFSVQSKNKSNDEVGELAKSFNLMASELKSSYSALEGRVREKTAQIRKEKNASEAERAKLETFFACIGEPIVAMDINGAVISINKATENVFGVSAKKAVGLPFKSVFHLQDDKGQFLSPDAPPVSTAIFKKKTFGSKSYLERRNNDPLALFAIFSPIIVNGKKIGVIATFRNISEEQELERNKSDFISLASHQLRTPLTSIKWMLQSAAESGNLNEWKKEYLSDALLSTERMIGLIHDLLNVSRLDSGDLAMNPEKTDLADLIEDLIRVEIEPVAKGKKQRIVFKKSADKVIAIVDKQLIRQVISNLVSNALRYSKEQTTVTISLKKTSANAAISVEDEGIGIAKKDQEHLFEKFYRSREASKFSTTGSGLGLYIIEKVLRTCHGKVNLVSKKGKGSRFTVTLPLKAPARKTQGKELFAHIIS